MAKVKNTLEDTLDYIEEFTDGFKPEIGIILGSGLGELADEYQEYAIPYDKIPGFVKSTVAGHKGQLVFAHIGEKKVVMMQGRNHFYEGHSMEEITYPVKVMKKLGVKTLIVTNAAGAINKSFRPGDLMTITDHINNMGTNPLIGVNDEDLGARFPDMTEIYNKEYVKLIDLAAKKLGIPIKHGVYIASSGPSYETPAEINAARILGADAAGMSTVPEAIVANYCGMKVIGISCISNYASGISSRKLSHEEVIETTNKVKTKFKDLVVLLVKNIYELN
ncbi:purine-nucleoside phosphorylase [bacterium]|nr:purine-nucleoside phosphorylase [bacterium]